VLAAISLGNPSGKHLCICNFFTCAGHAAILPKPYGSILKSKCVPNMRIPMIAATIPI